MSDYKELSDYKYTLDIATRWEDNDQYAHINNVKYYSYFDTTVNTLLYKQGFIASDLSQSKVKGLVVETQCRYFAPISFPETVTTAVSVSKIGSSSVIYQIGVFCQSKLCAQGHFVHVYVDEQNKPKPLLDEFRQFLQSLQ